MEKKMDNEELLDLVKRASDAVIVVGDVRRSGKYVELREDGELEKMDGDPHSESINVTFSGEIGIAKDIKRLLGIAAD